MALMYLSKENFTCPIVQISLYLSVPKQFTHSKTVCSPADTNSLINSVDPDLKKPADQDPHCFQCNI